MCVCVCVYKYNIMTKKVVVICEINCMFPYFIDITQKN